MEGVKNGYIVKGKFMHCRTAGQKGQNTLQWVQNNLDHNAKIHITKGKHRYLMPLNNAMRKQIEPLRKPYPKRGISKDGVAACNQQVEGGSIPTMPL